MGEQTAYDRNGIGHFAGKAVDNKTQPPLDTNETAVSFSLFAPQAYSVNVAGSFNNWTPGAFPLKKDESGTWRGSIRLKKGTYQYRFFVDRRWIDDPSAVKTAANEFGSHNAVLEVA